MDEKTVKVHQYSRYREYLKDWFWERKQTNKKFSFRYMANQLGLKAPNHFHLVLSGKRHLSEKTFKRLLPLLKLSAVERTYIKNLFRLETEVLNWKSQLRLKKELGELKSDLAETDLPYEELIILSNLLAWFVRAGAVVFEGMKWSELKLKIVRSCPFPITETDARRALEFLKKLGHLEVEENQVCHFHLNDLKSPLEFDSDVIKRFHFGNMKLALETLSWPVENRFFSNVTIPCDEELWKQAQSEIRRLCIRLMKQSREKIEKNDATKVVSLQVALFPYFLLSSGQDN